MKILLINKYLHPKGGAETYLFQLGTQLQQRGHQVAYFGMDHENRKVGNPVGAYVRWIDYRSGGPLGKLRNGLASVYSLEARRQLRRVLEDFQPDVCHLNNFHHQLTPAILLEIQSWRQREGRSCRIVHTAHDSQLVCSNHLMRNPQTGENCRQCLTGSLFHCIRGRCIHGSLGKSLLAAVGSWYWNRRGVYRLLDTVIVPSRFLAEQLSANPQLRERMVVLPNFAEMLPKARNLDRQPYVLYFGRFSREKGIETLLKTVDMLPQVDFVFAGEGPLKEEVEKRKNIRNRGFLSGGALEECIRNARFSVMPSECFENCPYSVVESLVLRTPVLAADIGGIPELVRPGENGELFESGNSRELARKIRGLWQDRQKLLVYGQNCENLAVPTPEQYCARLEEWYRGKRGSAWERN